MLCDNFVANFILFLSFHLNSMNGMEDIFQTSELWMSKLQVTGKYSFSPGNDISYVNVDFFSIPRDFNFKMTIGRNQIVNTFFEHIHSINAII